MLTGFSISWLVARCGVYWWASTWGSTWALASASALPLHALGWSRRRRRRCVCCEPVERVGVRTKDGGRCLEFGLRAEHSTRAPVLAHRFPNCFEISIELVVVRRSRQVPKSVA